MSNSKSLRRSNARKLAREVLSLVPGMVGTLVPKSRKKVALGAWNGHYYADNSKYLIEHLNRENDLDVTWITSNKEVERTVREEGIRAYRYWHPVGWWHLSRSYFWFFTHSPGDISSGPFFRNQRINLTHGVPLKNIGSRSIPGNVPKALLPLYRVWFKLLPASTHIFVSSEEAAIRFRHSFSTGQRSIPVVPLGYPRWKPLMERDVSSSTNSRRILYAPTHRGFGQRKFDFANISGFEKFTKFAIENGYELILRAHVAQSQISEDSALTSWKIQNFHDEPDTSQVLVSTEVLITDYSSIFYDYSIFRDKVIFLSPDLEQYTDSDQGIYCASYAAEVPGSVVNDWNEALRVLKEQQFAESDTLETFRSVHGKLADENLFARIEEAMQQMP